MGGIVALTAEADNADDLIGPETVVVDDRSLTVLPDCDDTHTHLIFAGRAVNDVQVAGAKDLGEFLGLIARRAASMPRGRWIRTASNWHELQLAERRMPTRAELDSAARTTRSWSSGAGTTTWSTAQACGWPGSPPARRPPREASSSKTPQERPTCRFEDSAIALVEQLLPAPRFDEQAEGLRLDSAGYAATGIGAVRDAAVNGNEVALLRAALARDALSVRTQGGLRQDLRNSTSTGAIASGAGR